MSKRKISNLGPVSQKADGNVILWVFPFEQFRTNMGEFRGLPAGIFMQTDSIENQPSIKKKKKMLWGVGNGSQQRGHDSQ